MALIKCEGCGHMISDKAKKCPKCGRPTTIEPNANSKNDSKKNEGTKKRNPLWLALAAVALILACGGYFLFANYHTDKNEDEGNNADNSVSVMTDSIVIEDDVVTDTVVVDTAAAVIESSEYSDEYMDDDEGMIDNNDYVEDVDNKSTEKNQQKSDEVHTITEIMPKFQGNVMDWVSRNIRYPEEAAEKNIQGRVVVKFIIDEDGCISQPQIARSVHPLLDAEAMRLVRTMPRWTPGYNKGNPCKVEYTLPVDFKI
jgi:protein TonB